jgi:hypothetical protein
MSTEKNCNLQHNARNLMSTCKSDCKSHIDIFRFDTTVYGLQVCRKLLMKTFLRMFECIEP